MMGTTHRIGGLMAGIIVLSGCPNYEIHSLATISGALIGSLLPDIDNPHSTISKKMPLIAQLVQMIQRMIWAVSRLLPGRIGKNIRSMFGHRGIFHSLIFPILLCLICQSSRFKSISLGLLAGMLSHLLLDAFSGGIPLFMPISVKRFRVAKIKTGGVTEKIFGAALTCAVAISSLKMLL